MGSQLPGRPLEDKMITTIQYAATASAVGGMISVLAIFPIAIRQGRLSAKRRIKLIRTSTWLMRLSIGGLATLVATGFMG